MKHPDADRKTLHARVAVLLASALLLLLPAVYALSIGPCAWITVQYHFDEGHPLFEAADRFYFPVEWLTSRSSGCDAAVYWYLGLWVDMEQPDPEVPDTR